MTKVAFVLSMILCLVSLGGCADDPPYDNEVTAEPPVSEVLPCWDQEVIDETEAALMNNPFGDLDVDCHIIKQLSNDAAHVYFCRTFEGRTLTLTYHPPAPQTCLPKPQISVRRGISL